VNSVIGYNSTIQLVQSSNVVTIKRKNRITQLILIRYNVILYKYDVVVICDSSKLYTIKFIVGLQVEYIYIYYYWTVIMQQLWHLIIT